jgi:hypothetical protein
MITFSVHDNEKIHITTTVTPVSNGDENVFSSRNRFPIGEMNRARGIPPRAHGILQVEGFGTNSETRAFNGGLGVSFGLNYTSENQQGAVLILDGIFNFKEVCEQGLPVWVKTTTMVIYFFIWVLLMFEQLVPLGRPATAVLGGVALLTLRLISSYQQKAEAAPLPDITGGSYNLESTGGWINWQPISLLFGLMIVTQVSGLQVNKVY